MRIRLLTETGNMTETNFYSYMFAQADNVAFDELAEVVDLSSPESIQRAFASYLEEFAPPAGIKDDLLEEKFYESPNEGKAGDETYIRYDMAIPGMKEDVDSDELKTYFEDFLEKIGAENNSENGYGAEIEKREDERGGIDIDIYLYIRGKQIAKKSKD